MKTCGSWPTFWGWNVWKASSVHPPDERLCWAPRNLPSPPLPSPSWKESALCPWRRTRRCHLSACSLVVVLVLPTGSSSMPLHPFLECWTLSYLFWIDFNLGGGSYWRLAVSSPRVDVIDNNAKSTNKDINCIMTNASTQWTPDRETACQQVAKSQFQVEPQLWGHRKPKRLSSLLMTDVICLHL